MKNSTKLLLAAVLLLVASPLFAKPVEVNDTVKIDYVKKKHNIKFYQEGERIGFNRAVKFLDQQAICAEHMKSYHKHLTNARIMYVIAIITMPLGTIILIAPMLIQQKKWTIALAAATDDFNNSFAPDESKNGDLLKNLDPDMFK